MSRCQINDGGYTFAELDIDETRLSGNGGADYPQLFWQIEMALPPPRDANKDYAFRAASAQLYFQNGAKIADSRPVLLSHVHRGVQKHGGHEYLNLEFPLDVVQIAAIERFRKSGPLNLTLHVQVQVDEMGPHPVFVGSNRPPIWGVIDVRVMRQTQNFQVSQSRWVDHVLPQIGYGKIHLVELPAIPLASVGSLQKAFDALNEAQEHHKHGFYNAAVMNCRQALESMLTSQMEIEDDGGNKRMVPALDERWKVRLGESTYTWLNEALASLKRAGNDATHRTRNNFDQFESQMIQAITVTLLAYAARATQETDGSSA